MYHLSIMNFTSTQMYTDNVACGLWVVYARKACLKPKMSTLWLKNPKSTKLNFFLIEPTSI